MPLLLITLESIIMFHVYTLIIRLDPNRKYIEHLDEVEIITKHEIEYNDDDIELPHLQALYTLFSDLNMPGLVSDVQYLIAVYHIDQSIMSDTKQNSEDNNDGDILV